MATYDNKHWLLSHIRNSFISTDDTRMCEIVMAGENFPKLLYARAQEQRAALAAVGSSADCREGGSPSEWREPVSEYDPYPEFEESEDDLDLLNGSYIRHEDLGPYRQRSNTAQWLEKKELAMKKAAKIKVIKWEDPPVQLTEEERECIFTKKDLSSKPEQQNSKKKSLLTEQLEKCPHLPHRQYLEYAKFDGTAQLGLPTKTFKIFMTMLPEELQNYPITVCVIASAKIQDLIGFTCYKYSIQHPEITLGPANSYGLCIAEDDGEVDWTFPCLDSNEPCSKFGFTCLGLVDRKSKNTQNQITSSIPEDGTLNGAFPMFPRQQTGGSGTSDAAIRALHAIHPEKKISLPSPRDQDLDKINSHILASEAPQYKSYNVQLSNKLGNTSIQLGISLERIEIEPLQSGLHKFWSRSKYTSYSIDSVAWCQIVEAKANKTVFRLVHSAGHSQPTHYTAGFLPTASNFKHYYFECEHEIAKEIVEKINRILDLRNSPCRRDYKAAKERKLQTRKSFHNPKI